jgi:hypothetical protein
MTFAATIIQFVSPMLAFAPNSEARSRFISFLQVSIQVSDRGPESLATVSLCSYRSKENLLEKHHDYWSYNVDKFHFEKSLSTILRDWSTIKIPLSICQILTPFDIITTNQPSPSQPKLTKMAQEYKYTIYFSSRDASGTMWCPDCRDVEAKVFSTFKTKESPINGPGKFAWPLACSSVYTFNRSGNHLPRSPRLEGTIEQISPSTLEFELGAYDSEV